MKIIRTMQFEDAHLVCGLASSQRDDYIRLGERHWFYYAGGLFGSLERLPDDEAEEIERKFQQWRSEK